MKLFDCEALDAADVLAPLRELFDLAPGTVYLDGNSLGALPHATAARVQAAVQHEWGRGLIGSWNGADWIGLPRRVGDKIARLVGAAPGQLIAADSTSVNLYKALSAALQIAAAQGGVKRRVVVSERSNFPTDLYIAESLARERGLALKLVEPDGIDAALAQGDVAVLMLTQVNYRSGRLHDMAAVTAAAHAAGALTVWDLAHSAGALPVDLLGSDADFAVGCGYKYLNGGPGAPAFVWLHPRHAERMARGDLWQPLSGWMGHARPFDFTPAYAPAEGIAGWLCGTPAVLSLTALECGVDTLLAAEPLGGLGALRRKSIALGELFIELVESRCAGHGLELASPRDAAARGSQVSFALAGHGYAAMQALIARGVVGDFRAGDARDPATTPDILRFGFTPLYTRFADVWNAVEQLRQVLEVREWNQPRFRARHAVT
ncbi:MAG TPA: kynureninase [Methylibium sp.]|uniref:kynureninase n=1 Tax=Methylibium sp. TaxID=2067992 RepID=UPI002DBFBFCD|nr:kynureninase [Methylibium sp.]HEU4459348.1 kynureninase [Methylibium sp.]